MNQVNRTKPISRERARRGVRWFVACSLLGLVGIFGYTSFADSLAYLHHLRPLYLIVALLLTLMDWLLGSARIYAFSGALHPSLKFISCFRAAASNIFLGGVTPSQTGGGPAQIYVLYKEGMSFTTATVSSIMCFMATVVFLVVCALYLMLFQPIPSIDPSLILLSRTTLVLFTMIILMFLLAILRPGVVERLCYALLGRMPRVKQWMERKGWTTTLIRSIHEYRDIIAVYFTRVRPALLSGMVLTVVMYLNKFFIAYIVIRGLNASAPLGEVIFIQMILFLVFYFAPSPGASGVAELTSGILMGRLLPPHSQAAFVILWRSFTLYFGMLLGGIIFFRYLVRDE
ncbi:MAG: flippase-like domain-containing protein [Candidatus Latescibacteria bacterium]|nr:flippase-like domain-containing protein [Candidatus Latescibacterota bacterium]